MRFSIGCVTTTPPIAARGEAVPPWVDAPPAARLASVASYCEWLMDRDRKSTALKVLQGKIWEEGYARGELVGDVFADVPGALERWRAQHLQIGIFSSGSVLAQQLLFRHSSAGDLTRFLQWYFDTTTGAKTDSESYRRIATAMGLPAGGDSVRLRRHRRARCGAPRRNADDAVGQAGQQAAAARTRPPGRSNIRRASLILRGAPAPIISVLLVSGCLISSSNSRLTSNAGPRHLRPALECVRKRLESSIYVPSVPSVLKR